MAKKQPKPPTFFVDRDLGKQLVESLRNAGYRVVAHDDEFDSSTLDTEWLPEVGRRGWILISRDKNITRNVMELNALIHSRVHAFFVNIKKPNAQRQIDAVTKAIPQILEIVLRREPPTVAIIHADGKVNELMGFDQLVTAMDERNSLLRNSRPQD